MNRFHAVFCSFSRPELVGIAKKVDRREAAREYKAHKAANIEEAIKKELLARLQQGVYPVSEMDSEIVNVPAQAYDEVVGTVGQEDKDEIDDAELDSLQSDDDAETKEDGDGDGDQSLEEEEEDEQDEQEMELEREFVEAYDDDIMSDDDMEDGKHVHHDRPSWQCSPVVCSLLLGC